MAEQIDWKKVGNAILRGFGAAAIPCATMLSPFGIPHWGIATIAGFAGFGSALSSVYELCKSPPYLDDSAKTV